jgi:transposase InsO family protein
VLVSPHLRGPGQRLQAAVRVDFGKLASRGRLAAIAPGRLVHVLDELSNRRFLCDTGASYSVFPFRSPEPPSGPSLTGPNGQRILCWGERELALSFHGVSFTWIFLLADVQFPILGIDFLRHYHLVVDAAGGQLVDARSLRAFPAVSVAAQRDGGRGVFSCIGGTPPPFRHLLVDYQDVLNPSGRLPPTTHGVEHHLPTTGRPVTARFRRLDPVMHAAAKAAFEDMENQGIVRRSSSCWASPLHMVKKADGTWRPCGNFWRLNLITEPDKYPLPRMDDLAAKLSGCKFFSKLDLKQGYHQIPMRAEDIKKTAIITPFGLFEYTRMPFGLRNSGQTFQRLMDRVIAGLDGVFCYLDDILVASPDPDSHRRHLQQLFDRLRQYGLVLNANKCVFGHPAVEFLGHSVTGDGAAPLEDKTAAIRAFPRPTTIKELQGFLGTVNFYRRFIPGAAKILAPLTDALKGGGKGSTAIGWGPVMEAAFLAAKASLVSAATLAHPSPSAELGLMVDASSTHVGASLQQCRGGGAWEPLGFFSRKLNTTQSKYSAFDRELWAVFSGIRFFRFMLEGRKFAVFTDHKPLTSALKRVSEPWTARQQRHLAYIAEYTSNLRHIAGVANVVADTLSRPPSPEKAAATAAGSKPGCVKAPPGSQPASAASGPLLVVAAATTAVDYDWLAREQPGCPSTQAALSSPSLAIHTFEVDGVPLLCDVSSGAVRPLVAEPCRRAVFSAIHSIAHAGVRASRRMLASRFVWPGMASDIAAWCKDCQDCARGKTTVHAAAEVEPIEIPSRRFSHLHVDFVGPLPTSKNGESHVLTIIDRSTRWVEAVPLASTTADSCASALVTFWVSRFGVPNRVTSDRGPQFASAVWAAFCKQVGIKHIMTTAYHPQSNGMVERVHRQLKAALRSRNCGADWAEHLPRVLMGIRAAPKDDTGVSSAELVYGCGVVLPGELQVPSPPIVNSALMPPPLPPPHDTRLGRRRRQRRSGERQPPVTLQQAAYVYVRRGYCGKPLAPVYSGPYEVVGRSPKYFTLRVGGADQSFSVDRLKPHTGRLPVTPAPPPRRGRPAAAASSTALSPDA